MLNNYPMVINGLMHKLRKLVYCISNMRACKGKLLEATNNSVILKGIKEHYSKVKCKCQSSGKGCSNKFDISYTCSSKEVLYIFLLRQKQALRIGKHFNSKIFEEESMGKELDEILQSLIIVTCNNNVININQKIKHSLIVIEDEQRGVYIIVGQAKSDKKSA